MNPSLKDLGLSLARQPRCLRDVRLHDGSPAQNTNVPGSDCISMTSAATLNAFDGGLGFAVRLVDMAARRTCARGVVGIDQDDRDTCKRCFIGNIRLQLKERPAM